ncbi:MAG TPA: nucleotide exchange factor GrpE [Malonomonas sp.]
MAKKEKKQDKQEAQKDQAIVDCEELEPEVLVEPIDGELEQLQVALQTAQDEVKLLQDQYLRTLADMDNLRKRTQRDKEELAKFANENILRDVLSVVDNLERAVEHAQQAHSSEGLLEGVQMTLTQLCQVLKKYGVVPVESIGQSFDPSLHQAIGQLETTEYPSNSVAQEMQKGYVLNERLLRPSMVMIAKAPAVPASDENSTTETDDQ